MTASQGRLVLYLNGRSVATASFTGAVNTNTGILAIGRTGAASSDYFRGSIDEAAIYPVALTGAQVANHYAVGSTVPSTPPTVDFAANPVRGAAALTVAFTDQSSGNPTSWRWDFGDRGTSTSQNPTHIYAATGTYTVSLTATNAAGSNTATRTDLVTATPPPAPTADFSASPTSGGAPHDVALSDRSSGDPTGWSWDFGDGTTSTLQNLLHTYAAAGTYTVRLLTVSNYTGSDTVNRTDLVTVTVPPPPAGYNTAVLADNPSGYWRLGETSGTSAADQTGAAPGTINGGVTGTPGALTADADTAMSFNGSTGYVSVANRSNLNPAGDLTVEAWAKPGGSKSGAIMHKGGSSGNSVWQYRLSLTSGNRWRGIVFSSTTAYTATDPGTPSTGWTHLAMTRSGSLLTLYVNGRSVATATLTGATNTSTGLLAIGRTGSAATDYFSGSVDEVAFYPTALSSSRIFAHYTAGQGGHWFDHDAAGDSRRSLSGSQADSPGTWWPGRGHHLLLPARGFQQPVTDCALTTRLPRPAAAVLPSCRPTV